MPKPTDSGGHTQQRSQRGRVSFAQVPFEAAWYQPLLQPIAFASNVALAAWMYPCWRTARVRWHPPTEVLAQRARDSRRPIIYYSWHAYEPLTLVAFRDVPDPLKPTAIGHDGTLSRMLQRTGAWFGYHLWIYRRKSPIRPKDQIIDLIQRRGCNIGLFPDAGGPYGRVKPGLAEIAAATNALVVPLVTRCRPVVMLRWPRRYRFPLLFSSLVVYNGAPLDGPRTSTDEFQKAMEELEDHATRVE